MKKFNEFIYRYGLHDCKLNNIMITDGVVFLVFNQGIYSLNNLGKEINLTNSCTMRIKFSDFAHHLDIVNQIDITRISNKKVFDTEFDDFANKVNKWGFTIEKSYYSYFCNTIMIKGYINRDRYEIEISSIDEILFMFSDN